MDKPWFIPLAVILKPFRLKCFEGYQFYHESAFNTPYEQVPSEYISNLNSRESLVELAGFRRVGLDLYQPPDNLFTILTSLHYSNERQTMALHCVNYYSNGWKPTEYLAFTTYVEGDRYVITSNVKGRLPIPNFIDFVSFPDRDFEKLNEIHKSRMSGYKRIWGNLTDIEVKKHHIDRLDRNYKYFYELGIYGPLEPA